MNYIYMIEELTGKTINKRNFTLELCQFSENEIDELDFRYKSKRGARFFVLHENGERLCTFGLFDDNDNIDEYSYGNDGYDDIKIYTLCGDYDCIQYKDRIILEFKLKYT